MFHEHAIIIRARSKGCAASSFPPGDGGNTDPWLCSGWQFVGMKEAI
jgi:hypothetical protein